VDDPVGSSAKQLVVAEPPRKKIKRENVLHLVEVRLNVPVSGNALLQNDEKIAMHRWPIDSGR